jgi:hypothetical protein
MKKLYKSFLIIFLLIVNIAVLYLYYKEIKINTKKNNCQELYINTIDTFIKYQGKKLNPEMKIANMESDTLTLTDIINNDCLIFYFNYLNCMPCVDNALSLFQEEIVKNKSIKCIILCSLKNEEELKLVCKINNIKIPLYKIIDDNNDLILQNSSTPLLFMINNNFEVNHAIMILPENSNIIKYYLKIQTIYNFK